MNTLLIRSSFLAFFLWVLIPVSLWSQDAPGGVGGHTAWYAVHDQSSTIGNHKTFDLLDLQTELSIEDLALDEPATLFFVLKPNFTTPAGHSFLRLGDLHIYDDHVAFPGGSAPLTFTANEPSIVTLQVQRIHRYAWKSAPSISIDDPQLFDIAEMIVYPGIHNREELRRVHSYLALKYSITITDVQDASWRDYWTDGNNDHYWDTRIDRMYSERVMGLGMSADERFFQSQTITTSGDEVQIALNEFEPIGEHPNVGIFEDAFLVFSEKARSDASSSLPCWQAGDYNPLYRWKFKLQNWNSDARALKIRVRYTPKKNSDSLFLSNGNILQYLTPLVIDSNIVEYSVDLDSLQSQMHYFFTTRLGGDCDNIEIGTDGDQIWVSSDDLGDQPWNLEIQSLADGSLTNTPESGGYASRETGAGQYVVTVLDDNGVVATSSVVYVEEDSPDEEEGPLSPLEIKIFPNPSVQGQVAHLSVKNLPSDEDVRIVVSDVSGRIHDSSEEEYAPYIRKDITLPAPGLYTISVYQEEAVYAVKLIVRSK